METTAEPPTIHRSPLLRAVYAGVGLVFVGIGALGVFIPGLPTTVFLIIAAWCFSRSSPRLEQWLLDLPVLGQFVRDYRAGLGMPLHAKLSAYGSIVVFVGVAVIFVLDGVAVRVGLVLFGLTGLAYIHFVVPTRAPAR